MAWQNRGEIRGPVGTFDHVDAVTLAPDSEATAAIGGTPANRTVVFGIPEGKRGLPGVNAVANDTATATYLDAEDSESRPAAQRAAGDGLAGADANAARLGLLRAILPTDTLGSMPALRRWREDLLKRHGQVVTLGGVFDSIGVGVGAGGSAGSFVSVLLDELRRMHPTNGSIKGGQPSLSMSPDQYGPWTFEGGATATTAASWAFSPDRYSVTLGPGQAATGTFFGTGGDLLFTSATGLGVFTWSVDGGPVTSQSSDATYPGMPSRVQVRGLTEGEHTIRVAYLSGGQVHLSHFVPHNGHEAAGLRFIKGAVGGTGTTFWNQNDGAGNYRHLHWLGLYEPSLFIIGLGTNDYFNGSAQVTPAVYKANIEAIIARVKAGTVNDPSFVLLAPAPTNPVSALAPWKDYKTALYAIADADPNNVAVFDWGYRMNPLDVATLAGGLMGADLVHPTVLGHEFIGLLLARFLGVV